MCSMRGCGLFSTDFGFLNIFFFFGKTNSKMFSEFVRIRLGSRCFRTCLNHFVFHIYNGFGMYTKWPRRVLVNCVASTQQCILPFILFFFFNFLWLGTILLFNRKIDFLIPFKFVSVLIFTQAQQAELVRKRRRKSVSHCILLNLVRRSIRYSIMSWMWNRIEMVPAN